MIGLDEFSLGLLPTAGGLTRLAVRFCGRAGGPGAAARAAAGQHLDAARAAELGLVTETPDDLDWDDELRLVIEERASFSPDALTGMEANLRFAGPGDLRDQDLRPAVGLAELDLPAAQRGRARRRAAPVRHRPASRLRQEAGLT